MRNSQSVELVHERVAVTDVGKKSIECGLSRGSFITLQEIAVIRELIRYRKKLIEARIRELRRLGEVREDGGIKITLQR